MSGKSKPHFVPPIDLSLLKRLHTPNSWILDRTTENIDWFNKVLSGTPRNYTWESLTAEAFKELGSSLARKLPAHEAMNEIYRLYWHDMLGQIEAFSIMSAWRLGEIARSAVWAIRRGEVVCAAVMSRAAIETAAGYAWLKTEIRPGLETIGQGNTPTFFKYHEGGLEKDLEDKLLKVVFSSKLEDAEEFYKPTNILTIIQHIAKKIPDQEIVAETYFRLCEMAHPNWAGRAIYITSIEPGRIPGHEKRTIADDHGATAVSILRDTVSALSWSTGTFSGCCVAIQETVDKMAGHLGRISD